LNHQLRFLGATHDFLHRTKFEDLNSCKTFGFKFLRVVPFSMHSFVQVLNKNPIFNSVRRSSFTLRLTSKQQSNQPTNLEIFNLSVGEKAKESSQQEKSSNNNWGRKAMTTTTL
jgi:hypothetical protein